MVADLMPASSPSDSSRTQHLRPVLALGAAGPGMDFEIGIETVGFARQQRLEFAPRDFLLEVLQRGFSLGNDTRIALGLAELDHADIVLELLLDLADARQRILKRGALLHQLLGLLRIVPEVGIFCELVQLSEARRRFLDVKDEVGIFCELVQLSEARRRFLDVKDASSAARLTA